jgi:basic amino acid/polyamine antiporter, APA family
VARISDSILRHPFQQPRSFNLAHQLFTCKSIDKLISESEEPEHRLKKTLGPWSLTALGIGAVIGSGIFTVIGTAIAGQKFDTSSILNAPLADYIVHHVATLGRPGAGPAIAVSLVLVAIVCGFTALCYAELASMIPIAGSAYTYTYATMGELIAWIIGWDLILEYAVSNMAVSVGFAAHLVDMFDWFGWHPQLRWITPAYLPGGLTGVSGNVLYTPGWHFGFNFPAFLIVMLLTVVLVRGIRESAETNNVMVILKISAILAFVFVGMKYIHPSNYHPFVPEGWSGVLTGGSIIFFTYIGFDSVSTAAEEAKNPQRDLPIGMIASLAICTVLYIAVAGVLTGMVHWQQINIEAPVAIAFLDRGLTTAANIITLGALAGLTSVMLVMLLGQTRVLYAMASDGLLPKKFFAAVHPKFRTPWKNTILVGLLAAVVGSVTPIEDIGKMVNIGTLLAFVIVSISVMVLRYTNPSQPRPFRTPWVPLIPILGVISNGYMMYKLGMWNWIRLFGWLAIGLVVYFTYSVKHSRVQDLQKGSGQ